MFPPLAEAVNECRKITVIKLDCTMAVLDEHVISSTNDMAEMRIQGRKITLDRVALYLINTDY